MVPWLWIWAPHLQLPLSGNVTQDIDPVVGLFNGRTDRGRGDPQVEQRAFRVASYGQQLGLITDVLLSMADEAPPKAGVGQDSLKRLKTIQTEIEQAKAEVRQDEVERLVRSVRSVLRHGGQPAETLRDALRLALDA
jgi:hypothetical protein